MNKILPIAIGAVLTIMVGGLAFLQNSGRQQSLSNPPAPVDVENSQTYTMEEIATHNTVASCWTVIDGGVYDLTAWIPQHPGGEAAIESLCGSDGTTAFRAQHGTAQRQADILAAYMIGTLARQ